MKNTIAIANDHAGFEMKKVIVKYLEEKGYDTRDFGSYTPDSVDYPDFAHPLASAIESGEYVFGITLCGSGNGINMVTNKHQDVRAALCWNREIADLARRHNDANVCSIPARFVDQETAKDIIDTFLSTDFEGGRHIKRIQKIPIK